MCYTRLDLVLSLHKTVLVNFPIGTTVCISTTESKNNFMGLLSRLQCFLSYYCVTKLQIFICVTKLQIFTCVTKLQIFICTHLLSKLCIKILILILVVIFRMSSCMKEKGFFPSLFRAVLEMRSLIKNRDFNGQCLVFY